MKGSALFLLGLIVISNAFTSEFMTTHKQHYGGKNIMDLMIQIEAGLKQGGQMDYYLKLLDFFRTNVNQEQARQDDLYSSQKKECDDETSFRVREVSDANGVLKSSTNLLNRANVQKGKVNAELGTTSDQLIQYQQHLEIIQQVRRAQQENFSRVAVVYNDASRALEDAVDLANSIQTGGASFAELADHTGKMVKQAMELGKVNAYAAVLASLAKMSLAQKADASDVERLVSLLQNLKQVLQDNNTQWNESNSQNIQIFQAQKERIENNIVRLQKSEEALKVQLQNLNATVAQQTAVSQQASNKRARNQKLLDDATRLCNNFETEFKVFSQSSRNELKMAAELEQLVRRRYGPTVQ